MRPVVFAALLAVASLATPLTSAAQSPAPSRILVMPFENVSRDGRIFWLGEAASILLADELNALGAPAITRLERRKAFDQLQVPPAAVLSDATVVRIGQLLGAAAIIVGSLRLEGDDLLVDARYIVLDAAKIRDRAAEKGPLTDLYAIFERVARRLVPAPATGVRTTERQPHPPVAAFEHYVKGLLAQAPETAVGYLRAALEAYPTFDRAKLALWASYSEQDDHRMAAELASSIAPDSPLRRPAQFRLGLSQLELGRYDQAFDTFAALSKAQPTAAVLNNLGVAQLRRGGAAPPEPPTTYFQRAGALAPGDSDIFFNLGYAYWRARDAGEAIRWLREAVRRNTADGEAHYVLGAALASAGDTSEANREKELARRLSSVFADWDQRPAADAVPSGLERLADDVTLPTGPLPDPVTTGQRDQREQAAFHIARAHRLYEQESDREAFAELGRALFLAPYDASANLLQGRIHLRAGRVQDAVGAFKVSIWSAESAAARAGLAAAYLETKDIDGARTEASRALALDPSSSEAQGVLDRASRADR